MKRFLLDPRLLYGLGGFMMSIAAHELFHILMHLGEISGFRLFPDRSTVFEVIVNGSPLQTTSGEEAVAYTITLIILFMTVIDVFAIHDAMREGRAKKSIAQTVFSKKDPLASLDDARMHELLLRIL